jgi:UDP-N-acetylmuramoylalanine--D-glutamate ligase
VIPEAWRRGEVAVVGLGASGRAAALLLRRLGARVYASDISARADLEPVATELRAAGVDVGLADHDLVRIERCAAVVLSPGVPPDAEASLAARRGGAEVVSELELGARVLTSTRLVAITGTKGKSTTAAMAAHLLHALGLGPRRAAGNIGWPLCAVALERERPAWLSVEASSFQLHDSPSFAPAVGVLTNLSPDHLDRYPSVASYYADKKLLFSNATEDSRWVVNGDDPDALELATGVPGVQERFSLQHRAAAGFFDRAGQWLVLRGTPLMRRSDLDLLGDHNVANALAALLAVPEEADRDRLAGALRTFRPLAHRLEPVREAGGVLWVDDSKGTTIASTIAAVRSVDRPVVVLMGGVDKGSAYEKLKTVAERVRGVVAYGKAAPLIERALSGAVPVQRAGDFAEVIARARAMARPGDAVLLSPACSSFDMFQNAEERGERFRELVERL